MSCGDENLAAQLAVAAIEGHAVGIDSSEYMIRIASEQYPSEKYRNPFFSLPNMDTTDDSTCPLRIQIIVVLIVFYFLTTGLLKAWMLFDPDVYEMTKSLVQAMSFHGLLQIPFLAQVWFSVTGMFLVLLSGIFMWQGKRWALYLFSFWIIVSLLLTLLVTGFSFYLALKLPMAMILLILLYTGKAWKFFSQDHFH